MMNPETISAEKSTAEQSDNLFAESALANYKRTDKLFAQLLLAQWAGAIGVSIFISPLSWAGKESNIHIHLYVALLLGAVITLYPAYLGYCQAGKLSTRLIISMAQMFMSSLLIHLTGGRIETHFHVFGSLAFLAFYRDWRVIMAATVVVALDHIIRGYFFPFATYGVLTPQPWRWVEHAFWVVFEDIILFLGCAQWNNEMRRNAGIQSELFNSKAHFEHQLELAKASLAVHSTEITASILSLTEMGSSILTAASQLSATAAQAETAVTQTTSLVIEARQISKMSHQVASKIYDEAVHMVQISNTGQQSTSGTIDGMKRIRNQMESIIESMGKLTYQSKAIGEIIASANELAQQSNILAVNASIEAAKAGEHGQGFGVLAGEIRELAQQSKEATSKARKILEGIAKAASEATAAAQQGSKVVEEGESLAKSAGDVIMALSNNIDEAAKAATQINKSNREQLAGMEQVVGAINNVSQANEDSLRSAKELEAEAANLNQLGLRLKQLVSE